MSERTEQLQGIDYQVRGLQVDRGENGNYFFSYSIENIDAKAIASNIPTFSFEILGRKSSGQIGWLIQPPEQN